MLALGRVIKPYALRYVCVLSNRAKLGGDKVFVVALITVDVKKKSLLSCANRDVLCTYIITCWWLARVANVARLLYATYLAASQSPDGS